jgi:hypothetical protein
MMRYDDGDYRVCRSLPLGLVRTRPMDQRQRVVWSGKIEVGDDGLAFLAHSGILFVFCPPWY